MVDSTRQTAGRSAHASGSAQIFQADRDIYVGSGATGHDAGLADLVPRAPVAELDPHDLGVHVATLPAGSRQNRPTLALTPYLERAHDAALRAEIRQAAAGCPSVLALLVGDSTTGKTRALYEALNSHEEVRHWPMLRPANAEELRALLSEGRITSGTVLWLNETQKFLYGVHGERSAYGLLRVFESTRQIIFVGAIWRAYLDDLTDSGRPGDPTAGARELLDGPHTRKISVPSRMSSDEKRAMAGLLASDARLTIAVAASGEEGQVIQHLTGGPELLDVYLNGGLFNPVEHALITAALEARRLGHNAPLSGSLLAAAADGYLTTRQRPGRADWASMALVDITTGVRSEDGTRTDVRRTLTGLTAIRTRSGQADPAYEPNDFLDQNTRPLRQGQLGTPQLWDAMAEHATAADDLYRLGRAAHSRGLYRHAAIMWSRALASGQPLAAAPLLRAIARADDEASGEAAAWIAEHSALDDARGATALIRAVHGQGATEVQGRLASRIAEDVSLDSAADLADLVGVLHRAGEGEAVGVLAARVAQRVSLESPRGIVELLKMLVETGSDQAASALAGRAAHDAPLESSRGAALLLKGLKQLPGAEEAVGVLADRAARLAPLDSSRGIGLLIRALRRTDANTALVTLLSRDLVAHASLDSPRAVGALIRELRKAQANQAATNLAMRAAQDCPLNDSPAVAYLIRVFRKLDTSDPLKALTGRITSLVQLEGATEFTDLMQKAGVDDALIAIAILAVTAADPGSISYVIRVLQETDRNEVIQALAAKSAEYAPVGNPRTLAALIDVLHRAGAPDSAARLAARTESARIESPRDVAYLIRALLRVEEHCVAPALAARAAEHASLDNPRAVTELLEALRQAQFDDAIANLLARNPVMHVSLGPGTGNHLFRELRELRADDIATEFLVRSVNAGSDEHLFSELIRATARPADAKLLRQFGREPDGRPSRPWGWRDLPRPARLESAETQDPDDE
jgi:hypothetical protein